MTDLLVSSDSNTKTKPQWSFALAMIIVAGVLIGGWFFLITYHYHLTFFSVVSPMLAGSAVIAYAIWKGRIQHCILSLVLGVLLASIIYGTFQGLRYFSFRKMAIDQYVADYSLDTAQAEQELENTLLEKTTVISSAMPLSGSGRQVTGTEYLIYWLYDFGMILLSTVGGAWRAVGRLYCQHCNKYYGRIVTGSGSIGLMKLGWVDRTETENFLRLLTMKHFEQLGTLLKSKQTRSAGIEIQAERCDTCNTNPISFIAVRPRTILSSNQPMVFQHTLASDEYERLLSFATVNNKASWLPLNEQWLISMSTLALFIGGLTLLIGLLQNSMS
jgi:hypothetical protein